MMKYCILLLACSILYACNKYKCNKDSYSCPPPTSAILEPIPYRFGDPLRFKNDLGDEIVFHVSDYNFHRYDAKCDVYGYNPCSCSPCGSSHTFTGICDSIPWSLSDELKVVFLLIGENYRIDDNNGKWQNDGIHWTIEILDSRSSMFLAENGQPSVQNMDGSSYVNYYQAPFKTYESYNLCGNEFGNVIVIDDTSGIVSKVYFSLFNGIIGFDERNNGTTYCLKQ